MGVCRMPYHVVFHYLLLWLISYSSHVDVRPFIFGQLFGIRLKKTTKAAQTTLKTSSIDHLLLLVLESVMKRP